MNKRMEKLFRDVNPNISYDVLKAIREAAYYNWLNAGGPAGRDLEFWCEAERQIVGGTAVECYDAVAEMDQELREGKWPTDERWYLLPKDIDTPIS